VTDKPERPLTVPSRLDEIAGGEGKSHSQAKGHLLRRDKAIRATAIAVGVMVLGYIYTDSLWAQQIAQQRISISQATNFPRDI